ncbi:MAG TPA: rhodanese-like domain-containing protein [Candidatus Acidoferrales bacterium]|nr:rhodanese-like domain-containing protein [Candidatus Acidoferrales bacterium]
MNDITVEELAQWHRTGKRFVLLDVRDPDEIETVTVDWARWIPMHEIPQRLAELPKDEPIAVMCHHGGRSERVAAFLSARGFVHVVNVDGGIDAYAERIDPSLTRY